MSLDGELVLGDHVEIVPLDALPDEMRAAIGPATGDYAITRPRTREPSRVVDLDSRDLLREFERPTRIVDAVIRFAQSRGLDPESTLERAFDVLRRLYGARVLVPATADPRAVDETRLASGSVVSGWTLRLHVQALDDTDVFYAVDDDGQSAAVKVLGSSLASVRREARAMRQAGARAPTVYGEHEWHGRGVVVSEWIYGDDVMQAASTLRGRDGQTSQEGLLALCCEVADAYAEIHQVGVLHGDVHPRNVLVESSGRVRLIDFGLAVGAGIPAPPARGVVAFYAEPELALALLQGDRVPSTAAGEQYALAAVLYLVFTGLHYLDWSLERSVMLGQIARAPALPFATRGLPAWPGLESVFGRALAKSKEARFESCSHFARALCALLPEARQSDEAVAKRTARSKRGLARPSASPFFERCGIGGPQLLPGAIRPPTASINYGAAGIAYAFYRLALVRGDALLLATADVWAAKAAASCGDPTAFHEAAMDITETTVGRASLFHSASGVYAVRALVALASGETRAAANAIAEFSSASRIATPFYDVALGIAGSLIGCAELVEAASGARGQDIGPLVARGIELSDAIAALIAREDVATSAVIGTLGLAHGWAGLLFARLRWAQARGNDSTELRPKLEDLARLGEPDGAGMRWPIVNRSLSQSSYMEGWCNGAAGHAILWALAYEQLGDDAYGVLAERAARSAWASSTTVGTLCCGWAGIGYACAAAQRVTGDRLWHTRARQAAGRATADPFEMSHRDSLYKGVLGAVMLPEELDADRAAMPCIERSAP